MSEPKEGKKEKEETKDLGPAKEEEGPTINFLKVDRTLRPEGQHFEAEMGVKR